MKKSLVIVIRHKKDIDFLRKNNREFLDELKIFEEIICVTSENNVVPKEDLEKISFEEKFIFIKNSINLNESELRLQGILRATQKEISFLSIDWESECINISDAENIDEVRKLEMGRQESKGQFKNKPSVSVIIPVHNCYEYLERCLGSIERGTLRELEVIVVDDGSSDDSLNLIKRKCLKDTRFSWISLSRPSGHPGTPRNIGLAIARGDYVGFVDADDWVGPNYFADLYRVANAEDLDIVSAGRFFRVETQKTVEVKFEYYSLSSGDKLNFLESNYFSNIWNRIYKRSILLSAGIYFPSIYISEDFCFSVAIHLAAKTSKQIQGGSYHYTYNRSSSTTDLRRGEKGMQIVRSFTKEIEYLEDVGYFNEVSEKFLLKKMGAFGYTYERLAADFKPIFLTELHEMMEPLLASVSRSSCTEKDILNLKKLRLYEIIENEEKNKLQRDLISTLSLSNSAMRSGKYEEAKNGYLKILKSSPNALVNLMIIFIKERNFSAARLLLQNSKDKNLIDSFKNFIIEEVDLNRNNEPSPTNPKVSIIVPVYNSGLYLNKCLDSIIGQTYKNIEIIIINDGSKDNSDEIIKQYEKDPRIVYIKNEKPSGNPGSPRNLGMKSVTGFYIAFVDSDDWIADDYIEKMVEAGKDGSDIVFSDGYINCVDEKRVEVKYKQNYFNSPEHPLYRYHESFTIWDKIYRSDFIFKNKIFLGETAAAVDVIFVFKSYYYCNRAAFCNGNTGYFYRRESDSSVTLNKRKKSNCNFEFEAYSSVEAWAIVEGTPQWFNNLIGIKKINSFLYTLTLIAAEFKEDFRFRAHKETKNIDEFVVKEYMGLLGREENLKRYIALKNAY